MFRKCVSIPDMTRFCIPGARKHVGSNAAGATYTFGKLGGSACPRGYAFIGSLAECAKAAAALTSCYIKIVGTCKAYTVMSDHAWFDDSEMGGPKVTTSEACEERRLSWTSSCGAAANVTTYFNGDGTQARTHTRHTHVQHDSMSRQLPSHSS